VKQKLVSTSHAKVSWFRLGQPEIIGSSSPRPDWLHEVKYDGYRLRLEREGDRLRLITRVGYWTDRYP